MHMPGWKSLKFSLRIDSILALQGKILSILENYIITFLFLVATKFGLASLPDNLYLVIIGTNWLNLRIIYLGHWTIAMKSSEK